MGVGLVGNVSFVIGSILFLLNMSAATFFVIGSIGMLLDSAGYMFVEIKTRGLRNRGYEPFEMATLRKFAAAQRASQSAGAAQQAASAPAAPEDGSGRASG